MEQRKQLYRVINIITNECLAENFTSADVSAAFGVEYRAVSKYAEHGNIAKGMYRIVKQNKLPEKIKAGISNVFFWKEWKRVTESINSKITWCEEPGPGVRVLYEKKARQL